MCEEESSGENQKTLVCTTVVVVIREWSCQSPRLHDEDRSAALSLFRFKSEISMGKTGSGTTRRSRPSSSSGRKGSASPAATTGDTVSKQPLLMRRDVVDMFDTPGGPTYQPLLREFASRLTLMFDVGPDTGASFAASWDALVASQSVNDAAGLRGMGVLFAFCYQRLVAMERLGGGTRALQQESQRQAELHRQQQDVTSLVQRMNMMLQQQGGGGGGADRPASPKSRGPRGATGLKDASKGFADEVIHVLDRCDRSGQDHYGGASADSLASLSQTLSKLSLAAGSSAAPRILHRPAAGSTTGSPRAARVGAPPALAAAGQALSFDSSFAMTMASQLPLTSRLAKISEEASAALRLSAETSTIGADTSGESLVAAQESLGRTRIPHQPHTAREPKLRHSVVMPVVPVALDAPMAPYHARFGLRQLFDADYASSARARKARTAKHQATVARSGDAGSIAEWGSGEDGQHAPRQPPSSSRRLPAAALGPSLHSSSRVGPRPRPEATIEQIDSFVEGIVAQTVHPHDEVEQGAAAPHVVEEWNHDAHDLQRRLTEARHAVAELGL